MPRPLKHELIARLTTSKIAGVKSDPITAFRFSSDAQRRFTKALSYFDEIALRSGNKAGKTTIGAHVGIAMSRGEESLDGQQLPMLGTPNHGVVLAKGRAMAKLSVIKAYREAIGTWPHHIEKQGSTIEAIWVKPKRSGSDNWEDWSSIRFFVEGGQSTAGMRLDWVHADEPPDWDMWMELRMRASGNRLFPRFITFTPIDKREWKPIREDYKGCQEPDGKDGKLEIRMSVYDNKALGPAAIREHERASKGPLQEAKLRGEYVDLTATNPFSGAGLLKWLQRCREPKIIRENIGGRLVTYREFHEPDPTDQYFVIADPSGGIEDEQHEHDPAGIAVLSRKRNQYTKPKLVARYNGYLPAYDLGELGRKLAVKYNGAMLVWERNGGWGEAFFKGTKDPETGFEYGNVYMEFHEDSKSLTLFERLGWYTSAGSRGTIVSALQQAIVDDDLIVEDREAVESLQEVIMDKRNRIIAGSGSHDEDMIVLGLGQHLIETIPLTSERPESIELSVGDVVTSIPTGPRNMGEMEGPDW